MITTKHRRIRTFVVERRPRLTRAWQVQVRTSRRSEAREILDRKTPLHKFFAEYRVRQEDTVVRPHERDQ